MDGGRIYIYVYIYMSCTCIYTYSHTHVFPCTDWRRVKNRWRPFWFIYTYMYIFIHICMCVYRYVPGMCLHMYSLTDSYATTSGGARYLNGSSYNSYIYIYIDVYMSMYVLFHKCISINVSGVRKAWMAAGKVHTYNIFKYISRIYIHICFLTNPYQ